MQIKPKFPRFCGSVRYRNAGRLQSKKHDFSSAGRETNRSGFQYFTEKIMGESRLQTEGVPTGSGGEKQLPAEIHLEMACRGKAERPVLIVRPVVIPPPIDRSEREEGFFLSVF